MGEISVVVVNPEFKIGDKLKREMPIIGPNEVFFHGAKNAFSIGIALWVVPGGKDLPNFELGTRLHKRF